MNKTFFLEAEIVEVEQVFRTFTMICINYRSVHVGQERKVSANKNVLVCFYYKRGRTHRLIHVKGLYVV